MRLWTGQNKGCLRRDWHSLWSWLKLMRSLRAAVNMRTGIEINPKVRWPFQTVVAMKFLRKQLKDGARVSKGSRAAAKKQEKVCVKRRKGNGMGAPVGRPAIRNSLKTKDPVASVEWRVTSHKMRRIPPPPGNNAKA